MNVSNTSLTTTSTSGLFIEVTGNFGARNESWTTTSRFEDGEDAIIGTNSMTTSTGTTSVSWTSSTLWPRSTTSRTTTGTDSMTTNTVSTSVSWISSTLWSRSTTTKTTTGTDSMTTSTVSTSMSWTSSTLWPRSTTSKTTTGTESTRTISTILGISVYQVLRCFKPVMLYLDMGRLAILAMPGAPDPAGE